MPADAGVVEELFFKNIVLLGFDVAANEKKYGMSFTPDMFRKTNSKGMEVMIFFLLHRLSPRDTEQEFKGVWPIMDKSQSREFRKIATEVLKRLERDGKLPVNSSRGSTLQSAAGVSNPAEFRNPADMMFAQKVLKTHIVRQARKFKSYAQHIVDEQNRWKHFAQEVAQAYRDVCKEETTLAEELKAFSNTVPADMFSEFGSLERASQLERVRDIWGVINGQHEGKGALRDLVLEVCKDLKPRYMVDANSLLRAGLKDEGKMTQKRVEAHVAHQLSLYPNRKLDLPQMIKRFNAAVGTVDEALKSNAPAGVDLMPKVGEWIPNTTYHVHSHHGYLANARNLSSSLGDSIPSVKENIIALQNEIKSLRTASTRAAKFGTPTSTPSKSRLAATPMTTPVKGPGGLGLVPPTPANSYPAWPSVIPDTPASSAPATPLTKQIKGVELQTSTPEMRAAIAADVRRKIGQGAGIEKTPEETAEEHEDGSSSYLLPADTGVDYIVSPEIQVRSSVKPASQIPTLRRKIEFPEEVSRSVPSMRIQPPSTPQDLVRQSMPGSTSRNAVASPPKVSSPVTPLRDSVPVLSPKFSVSPPRATGSPRRAGKAGGRGALTQSLPVGPSPAKESDRHARAERKGSTEKLEMLAEQLVNYMTSADEVSSPSRLLHVASNPLEAINDVDPFAHKPKIANTPVVARSQPRMPVHTPAATGYLENEATQVTSSTPVEPPRPAELIPSPAMAWESPKSATRSPGNVKQASPILARDSPIHSAVRSSPVRSSPIRPSPVAAVQTRRPPSPVVVSPGPREDPPADPTVATPPPQKNSMFTLDDLTPPPGWSGATDTQAVDEEDGLWVDDEIFIGKRPVKDKERLSPKKTASPKLASPKKWMSPNLAESARVEPSPAASMRGSDIFNLDNIADSPLVSAGGGMGSWMAGTPGTASVDLAASMDKKPLTDSYIRRELDNKRSPQEKMGRPALDFFE